MQDNPPGRVNGVIHNADYESRHAHLSHVFNSPECWDKCGDPAQWAATCECCEGRGQVPTEGQSGEHGMEPCPFCADDGTIDE